MIVASSSYCHLTIEHAASCSCAVVMEMRWRHPLVISCSGSRLNLEIQPTNAKLQTGAFILSVRSEGSFRCTLLKIEAAYMYFESIYSSLCLLMWADVKWDPTESRFWSAASVLLPDRFPSSVRLFQPDETWSIRVDQKPGSRV